MSERPLTLAALATLVCLAASASCARRLPPVTPERPSTDCSYRYSAAVTTHCEEEGSGEETFVLLHGFAASLESWHDVRPVLARRGRVVMLDLKGFGLSSKPPDRVYTPADQADIVAAFIRERNRGGARTGARDLGSRHDDSRDGRGRARARRRARGRHVHVGDHPRHRACRQAVPRPHITCGREGV